VLYSEDKNTKFGVYKSEHCGLEIVIITDATFPGPKQSRLVTEWTRIGESSSHIIHLADRPKKEQIRTRCIGV